MPTTKSKAKAKITKAKNMQASGLEASQKRPASSTPSAETHSPSLVRAKKMKGNPEAGSQDSKEEAPFTKQVNSTIEDREKHIKELEQLVDDLRATVSTLQSDRTYMHGAYDNWPQIAIGAWPDRLLGLMFNCNNWALEYGFRSVKGKYEHLSKEQKKYLIASLAGYVIQDDFDKIVPRLPPNIRNCILSIFAGIIMVKEILSLFFTNPFWYLEWPDGQSSDDGNVSDVETPFGAQLNHLYQAFLDTDAQLARHWRAQTTRLSNASGPALSRNPAFGLKNLALRKAKIKQVVAARLADKSFQCLLKYNEDEYEIYRREVTLFGVYETGAELAMAMATSQPDLEWGTLEDVSPIFYRSSREIQAAHIHGLTERESRLNGHRVLAVTQPVFFQVGGWNRDGKDKIIRKGRVLVDDPIGLPEDAYSTDEDVRAKRKQRQAKRAAKKAEEGDKEKPPPKGKAKKTTKKKG